MSDAVTAGTFSDFKLVKTRNVAQLVIELPLERADEALELLGGLPRPSREVWVAIARLTANPFTVATEPATAPEPVAAPEEPKERRKFTDLPFSQRAAMLCQDELFGNFLCDRFPDHWYTAGCDATNTLRRICQVQSRTELNTDHDAAARFDRLSRDFWIWKNEPVSPAA